MNRPLRFIFSLAALCLLSACILVEQFGAVWNQAKPDTCLTKIAESLYYAEFNRDPSGLKMEDIARGWTVEGENFLLLKKEASDKGGRLYRFTVQHGIWMRYRLAPTMRAQFLKDYPKAPVSLERDTVTLPNLSDAPLKLLIEIAKKPGYWEVEDKILYNTMRNPTCRFEDRDLKKLEEDMERKRNEPSRR